VADFTTTIITRFEAITDQQDAAFRGSTERLEELAERIESTTDGFAKLKGAVDSTTDRIRLLGKRSAAFADAIDDGIADPMLRAKAAMLLFSRESKKTGGSLSRLRDRVKIAELQMDSFLGGVGRTRAAVGLLAIALGTALAASLGVATKAIGKFLETNDTTKTAVDRLKKAVGELEVALGSALVGGAEKAGNEIDDVSAKVNAFTTKIKENRDEIHALAVDLKNAFVWVADKLIVGLGIYLKAIALSIDNLEILVSGLGVAIGIFGLGLAGILGGALNKVKELTAGMIKMLDLMGAGAGIPQFIRAWSEDLVDLGASARSVQRDIAPLQKRLDEGWKRTRAVNKYIERVKALRAELAGVGDGGVDLSGPILGPTAADFKEPPKDPKGGAKGAAPKITPFARTQGDAARPTPWTLSMHATTGGIAGGFMETGITQTTTALQRFSDTAIEAEKRSSDFWTSFRTGAKEAGLSALNDFGSNVAQAFGTAIASGESMSSALSEVFRQTVADAAVQFGELFVLKGAVLTLENPALGLAMIAGGLALQTFGAAIGAGGAGASGSTSAPTPGAALSPAFAPRGGDDDDERTTIINVSIAGDQIRDPIVDIVNEGIRTRRVRAGGM